METSLHFASFVSTGLGFGPFFIVFPPPVHKQFPGWREQMDLSGRLWGGGGAKWGPKKKAKGNVSPRIRLRGPTPPPLKFFSGGCRAARYAGCRQNDKKLDQEHPL